tara:strand:+ start:245 stop:472 length:228 start_codon:yes stop_codon:yes gene_type:complete
MISFGSIVELHVADDAGCILTDDYFVARIAFDRLASAVIGKVFGIMLDLFGLREFVIRLTRDDRIQILTALRPKC